MITIKNIEYLFWHNRFAAHPVSVVNLNPDSATPWRFDSLSPAVRNLIIKKFPILKANNAGKTATEFLAAVCVSLQREKFDVPLLTGAGNTQFWFTTSDHFYTSTVTARAVQLLNRLHHPNLTDPDVATALVELEDSCEPAALDQSVRAIAAAADKRGIPWFRLSSGIRDIQLGHGHLQQRMRETVSSVEPTIAASYSRDKVVTCQLLHSVGLPVGHFAWATHANQATSAAKAMGFPVVVKPAHGKKGADVIIGLATADAIHQAATRLLAKWPQVIVQSFIPGDDHRLLVVSGRLVAAARREPAFVTGDGKHTIGQLIEAANLDPRRGKGFYRMMNYILIDDELKRVLAKQELTLSGIPDAGVKVRLRLTANISTGGTATDVTDVIHPDNVMVAERAASAIGLKVAGVDFLTPDISRSWREVGGGICEVNASPGLRSHWMSNPSRDVVGPILETIFPPGTDGRIPVALVTGSKGKAATIRILGDILRAAGHRVGSATADGLAINGSTVATQTGITGAAILLRDPTVTAAVLDITETDMLKSGLYCDYCDVAAVLDMDKEPAATLEQTVQLRRKIMGMARQKIIFNAGDKHCLNMARDFPAKNVVLFTPEPSAKMVKAHLAAGGTVVTLSSAASKPSIVIRSGKHSVTVAKVAPSGKTARDAIINRLAAVALAYGMNIPVKIIAENLVAFTPLRKNVSAR